MKKKTFISIILGVVTMLCACLAVGCGKDDGADKIPEGTNGKVLVAYFSCTNTTKGVAESIQREVSNSYLYQITPAIPYTTDDLKYYTNCRADREQADPTARPEISGSVENIEQYDVIFIGYPIWHSQAPKIIYTFLESYDFSGKTIIPFCTSASSGMGNSGTNLHSSAPNAIWKSGCRVSSSSDIDTLVNMQ
ncbi:MAG: flavodoxin [Clostridia bacterium]|nr:flavodoxin [Clostridia bacterium]